VLIDCCKPTCTCTHAKLSKTSFFLGQILNPKTSFFLGRREYAISRFIFQTLKRNHCNILMKHCEHSKLQLETCGKTWHVRGPAEQLAPWWSTSTGARSSPTWAAVEWWSVSVTYTYRMASTARPASCPSLM
jgi:hypothetical protein